MTIIDSRPFWAVGISLVAAFLIMFSGRHPNVREGWSVIAAVVKLFIILSMLPEVLAGNIYEYTLVNITDTMGLTFRTDPAAMLFACLSSFLWIPIIFYSIGYMRGHHKEEQTGFFAAFCVCISAGVGISMAANLLTFIVFYEILTVATYPLVIHARNQISKQAGRKYLAYTLIPGQLFVAGMMIVYYIAGTLDFQPGGFLTIDMAPRWVLQVLFFLLVTAGAVKAGVMPLHGWLPAAMVAPTPVSALLHAVAVVKAGAFCILRVIGFVFGPTLLTQLGVAEVMSWFAAFTIIVSSLIAIKQDNLKRRLAFSTVGQLSYVVLGASLMSPLSVLGAYFHFVAHAFMKVTLFLCAGAIFITTDKREISDMHGIGKQMPITLACFTIASFGLAGMPFVIGFISKWNLAMGALQVGKPLFVAVLVASALLSLSYLTPVAYLAFFKPNKRGEFKSYNEAHKLMLIPLCITAFIAVILGVMPNLGVHFYELAAMASHGITHNWTGGGW